MLPFRVPRGRCPARRSRGKLPHVNHYVSAKYKIFLQKHWEIRVSRGFRGTLNRIMEDCLYASDSTHLPNQPQRVQMSRIPQFSPRNLLRLF